MLRTSVNLTKKIVLQRQAA
jgi:hypothetical protein